MAADTTAPEDAAPGDVRDFRCHCCQDTGHVCENHPGLPWGGVCCYGPAGGQVCLHGACHCGAGMPCPACCSPVPEDGRHAITEAFVPDWRRA